MKTARFLVVAIAAIGTLVLARTAPASVPDRAQPLATMAAVQTQAAGGEVESDSPPTALRTPTPMARPAADDAPEGLPAGAQAVEVTGHVDGDKLRARVGGEEREVLLIGVDAPEIDEGPQGECYAADASEGLEELAPEGETVYLLAGGGDNEDGKNRLLRFAWVDDDGAALFVNEAILQEGFASFQAREGSDRFDADLQAADRAAREDDAGLWGECGGNHVEIVPPTAEPELGDQGLPAPIGTTLTGGGVAVTINSAYTTYQYGVSAPKGGYVFLVMEIVVENVDPEDNHGYADYRFSAEDQDTGADFEEPRSAVTGGLGNGDLSTGEYVSGVVGLEVQETSTNIRIEYGTANVGGESLYWLLQL